MFIQCFCCGPFETNAYIVACEETRLAALIDPALGSKPLFYKVAEERQFTLHAIYLTHSHFDHIADVAEIKKERNLPIFVHPLDAPNLEKPGSDYLPLPFPINGVKPDHFFEDRMTESIGTHSFTVFHTPGHSPGGVCLFFPLEKVLFSGDTLFRHAIGNLSFPTSNPPDMWESLRKLAELPADTQVFPGHGEPTTIKNELWLLRAEEVFGKP